jgi:signal transduction histidine kinase
VTDPQTGAPQAAAGPPPTANQRAAASSPGPGAQARSSGAAIGTGADRVARAATRIGNWLASIGWGKFFLLALLLLALLALGDSMLAFSSKSHRPKIQVPVELKVTVDSTGLHIAPAQDQAAPGQAAPGQAAQGQPAQGQAAQGQPAQGQAAPARPKVQIDEQGVRIQSDKNGRHSTVVIDKNGVRVEDRVRDRDPEADSKAGSKAGSKLTEVTVPPQMISDPDKVAEAVEAAKGQIEEIVQEQVDTKVAALRGAVKDDGGRWPDLADWGLVLVFALLIVKIAMGSKRRAESRAQAADEVAAEEGLKRQLAEAQLKTMQAQVEPHFLFNTLASVDYLIETDPTRASKMQKNLIQYLRAALPQMRQASSTLGQEMALCRSYLEILRMRMDDRLQFAITMPAGLSSAAFPPMMLQTLVENSIKHGLEPKPEGGVLTLSADVVDGNLRVAVSDTGLGFGAAGSDGGGVGLNNVRERLRALFGARGRLTIEANSPSGTIATIAVPYTVGAAEAAPQAAPQPA